MECTTRDAGSPVSCQKTAIACAQLQFEVRMSYVMNCVDLEHSHNIGTGEVSSLSKHLP